jgi:hypothetical protein
MTEKRKTGTKKAKIKKIRATNEMPADAPAAETAAPEEPAVTASKPKREKAPKEDLMTFAFRMPKTDSAALHEAAGPRNASNVMKALAGAFVREDLVAFEEIVAEARKLRA